MTWIFSNRKQDVIFESPERKNKVEYVIANQIGTPTVCIHRNILLQNKFNTALRINEDVELFARIVAQYQLIQIPFSTVDVLMHEENTRLLVSDPFTPQIKAMEIIFSNPLLGNKISDAFKKQRLRDLRHELINHLYRQREFSKMNKEIIHFLFLYPFDFQNKSKIVLLLYHLPGGNILQNLIGKLK